MEILELYLFGLGGVILHLLTKLYNAKKRGVKLDAGLELISTGISAPTGAYFDVVLDIGSPVGVIQDRIYTFAKGSGFTHNFSTTNSIYCLDTFLANGGKLNVVGGVGNTSIWDIVLTVFKP